MTGKVKELETTVMIRPLSVKELYEFVEQREKIAYEKGLRDAEKKEWLTPRETADFLGVQNTSSLSKIVNEDTKNIIKTRPWGNRRKQYNKTSLEEYLNRK